MLTDSHALPIPPQRNPRPSLNEDPLGRDLTITIRVAPDGRIFFHDITLALEPVAAALCPPHPLLPKVNS